MKSASLIPDDTAPKDTALLSLVSGRQLSSSLAEVLAEPPPDWAQCKVLLFRAKSPSATLAVLEECHIVSGRLMSAAANFGYTAQPAGSRGVHSLQPFADALSAWVCLSAGARPRCRGENRAKLADDYGFSASGLSRHQKRLRRVLPGFDLALKAAARRHRLVVSDMELPPIDISDWGTAMEAANKLGGHPY